MSYWMHLTHERLYPPHQIAAVAELLFEDGAAMEDGLHGTGLTVAALRGGSCRTSLAQHLQVCSNAQALGQDPSISFRAGERLHLHDHGMYGLLLLSCNAVRDYFDQAVKYQLLAGPAMRFEWHEGPGETVRVQLGTAEGTLPPGLEAFLAEQQLMQQLTHLRDALGTAIQPELARFAYPAPAHRELYRHYFQCPCVFDGERTELHFRREVLVRRPCLANPLAAATLQSTCDGLIADIEASLGIAGQVHRTLRELGDPGASMKAVAAALKMTDRTLRRRLADEGTSFTAIAHQVKYCVAAQHLKHAGTSIEQVASIAGFSDTANFRRAFIRWTHMTPAQFRRQNIG